MQDANDVSIRAQRISAGRLHCRYDKVEKSARFWGKIITRRMQRIERKSLIKPIRKDDLQASTLDQRFDSKLQKLCNTVTSEADCVNGGNVAQQQLRDRADIDLLTSLPEDPLVGAPSFRVPKINQAMIAFLKIRRMFWASRLLQIRW